MTYVKKSFINNSSNKKSTGHKLNNSIGNIGPFINNNFSLEKISNNKMNPPIEYIKYKNNNTNLNSSFKLANELGKTYYNIGNIFNIDNLDDDNNINLSNNFNINFNLDSLYNINYPFNKSKAKNNMFYVNNFFRKVIIIIGIAIVIKKLELIMYIINIKIIILVILKKEEIKFIIV